MTELEVFLQYVAELEPVGLDDIAGIRRRRELLASTFGAGGDPVQLIHETIAGVATARFAPAAKTSPGVLVYVHGGGWVAGDCNTHAGTCQVLADAGGFDVVSVDYLRAPLNPHPSPVIETENVIAALLARDPARPIAIGGDSSGAHIALEAMSRRGQFKKTRGGAALLLIQPACDPRMESDGWHQLGEGYFLTARAMRSYWAMYLQTEVLGPLWQRDLSSLPPTYVFTSSLDPTADEAETLVRKLCDSGIAVEHVAVDGYPHGCLTLLGAFPSARLHLEAAARWLSRRLSEADERDDERKIALCP